ncbi:MAG: glycosyltransferase family 2 protein [Gammaproteobacteria bacterium]|nr:glycosyltransferase family 2 protein [Gammaproteobacteria bacterium]
MPSAKQRKQPAAEDARVAVIVVNFNGGGWLCRSLAALERQSRSPDRVLVVDNASEDDSLEQARNMYPRVEYIALETNTGFAHANNLGVEAAADCDWIALLNPDAFPEPDWLEQLLAAAREFPRHGSFASRLEDESGKLDGTGDTYHVSGLGWRRDHGRVAGDEHASGEIFAPCAAAALYRREAWLAAGGLDDDFFCYFEDLDLGFRLQLLGYPSRYVSSARVIHVGSATTGRSSDFSVYHGHRNLVWCYLKNMPGMYFWLYLPQHLLLNLVSLLVFSARGRWLIWRAKWDALRGLGRALGQRRGVQAGRRATPAVVCGRMARGLLTPYRDRHG